MTNRMPPAPLLLALALLPLGVQADVTALTEREIGEILMEPLERAARAHAEELRSDRPGSRLDHLTELVGDDLGPYTDHERRRAARDSLFDWTDTMLDLVSRPLHDSPEALDDLMSTLIEATRNVEAALLASDPDLARIAYDFTLSFFYFRGLGEELADYQAAHQAEASERFEAVRRTLSEAVIERAIEEPAVDESPSAAEAL